LYVFAAVTQDEPGGQILVVEDDRDIRVLLRHLLVDAGYDVSEAVDALEAMELLGRVPPDLVLLDIGLPGIHGLDVLTRIRAGGDTPVILLTARGAEADRIDGLRGGADDYIAKPFSSGELLARIESVLRRSRSPASSAVTVDRLRFADLDIDLVSREVRVDESVVAVTAREFDLLVFMASSPRQVFTREQLLRQVWNSSAEWQDDATVTEHVRRLRRKIEVDPDHPTRVITVRGVGYRFEP
jgi:DNA-binding response OmpR family regulator